MTDMSQVKVLIEIADQSTLQIINALRALDVVGIKYSLKEEPIPVQNNYAVIKKNLGFKGLEILEKLSEGYTYNAIAEITDISIDGVRYYIKKIFRALGVKNGRDAIRIYLTDIKPNLNNSTN